MPEGQAAVTSDSKGSKHRLFHDLSADALVYGSGVVLQSALLFVSAPLYARLLPRAEYGALTLLLSVMTGGEALARFGVHYAFLTLVQHRAEEDSRRRLTRAAASALALQATILGSALAIAGVLLRDTAPLGDSRLAFSLIGLHVLLSAPAVLLQGVWRAEGRAARVVFLSVAQIGGACGFALLFVLATSLGATAVILGYVAASASCGAVAVAGLRPHLAARTDAPDLRELYRLGLGYTLIQLATLGLLHAGRWTLSFVDSLSAAAAYDVAYRVGQVVSLALVTPFSVAWTTGVFQVARAEAAGRVAGRVFTYLMAALAWLGLALCAFAHEAVLVVGGRAYLDAEPLVPALVFASVLWGAFSFLSGAPALARRSREALLATTAGLATCLGLNAALTPRLAALGAALALLLGSLVACAAMAHGARQWLAVEYEWPRLARIAGASAAILCLVRVAPSPPWLSFALRAGSVLAFPMLLRTLGFFGPGEWQAAFRLPAAALARARART